MSTTKKTHRGSVVLVLVLVLVLLLAPSPPARAQGDPAAARDLELRAELAKGLSFAADRIELDDARGVYVLAGNARLESKQGGAIQLYADGIVAWGRRKGKVIEDAEVYAEGGVYLFALSSSFEADWLYLDFRRTADRLGLARGRLENATVRHHTPDGRGELLARARTARVSNGLSSFEGEDAQISTCTYHEPHFALAAPRIRVLRRGADEVARVEAGEDAPPGATAELDRPRLEVYGIPVLPIPFPIRWDTAWNPFLPRPRLGKSGRFGYYALLDAPVYPSDELDLRARVHLIEKRGVGLGGVADWRGPRDDARTYEGWLDGYYIHDREEEDRNGTPIPDPDRGRIRGFHRDDLPLGFRRELEVAWSSDRNFLDEYFEPEAKNGKEQETALYLRWLGPTTATANMGATLLGRWRLNDFQTQTEYIPKAAWSWIGEPFLAGLFPDGRGVYLTTAAELANARLRFDEDTLLPSERVLRADLMGRLDRPTPLGPVQLDPFVLGRATAWDQHLGPPLFPGGTPRAEEPGTERTVAGAGALATIDVWRDFGGWRHIATPSVGYENVFHVSEDPDGLVPIDAVEDIRERESVPLALRNRIQTRRGKGDPVVNVVDWSLLVRAFPRPSQNQDARFGPLASDLRLAPHAHVAARWRSDWDPNPRGGLFRSDTELTVRPADALLLGAGQRYLEDTYRALEGFVEVRLTDKWLARASSQFDFEQDRFTDNRFALRRFFHKFTLDLVVHADFGEDDVRFAIDFRPLDLFGGRDVFVRDGIRPDVDPLY